MKIDIDKLVEKVRHKKNVARRDKMSTYKKRKSGLDVHKTVLFKMKDKGASITEIQIACRSELTPRIDRSRSSIYRYLNNPKNRK